MFTLVVLGVVPLVVGLVLLGLGMVVLVAEKKAGIKVGTRSIRLAVLGGVSIGVGLVALTVWWADFASSQYARKVRTSEVLLNLDKIQAGAAAYFSSPKVDEMGALLPCQFPETVECTPHESPCEHPDQRLPGDPLAWGAPTWRALGFEVHGYHRFRYCFESDGTGPDAMYTASAHADLDCDGIESTFKRSGRASLSPDGSDCSVEGLSKYVENETE